MLKEGEDYIVKKGFWIFTKEFHLRRGFCCGNGCKNCPYKPKHVAGNKISSNLKVSKNK